MSVQENWKPEKVFDSILETVGHTPMVRLNRVAKDISVNVLAKLESFNPGGSVKDRIGLAMIEAAERHGLIKPGYTIVEPTSGNTGLGLALAARVKGYKVVFTMPDKMSAEKVNLLRAFGAKVIVTPTAVPADHPGNYIKVAERIAREDPSSFMPNQYFNSANPDAHYKTTGPEIWEQTDGRVDVLVAGMGTGGTISGIGRYLKEKNPDIRIIGVDPEGSMYHHEFYGTSGAIQTYKVEGIGEDFMPSTLDLKTVDEIIVVSDKDAFQTARRLAAEEGIFAGGSSGAAVFAALQVAKRLDGDKTIVAILPDTGRNYMTKIYSDAWMCEHGFMETSDERILVEDILKSKSGTIENIISVRPDDRIETAVDLMMRHSVSQLPVVKDEMQVGSVSEKNLVERLCAQCGTRTSCGERCESRIEQIMEPPLPSVGKTDRILNPFLLLRDRNAMVVMEGQRMVDVITTIDVVNYLMGRAP